MSQIDPLPSRLTSIEIARCPEHGLHGERQACFVCGGPVEQVRMYPAEMWEEAVRSALIWKKRAEDLEDAIEEYALWQPGRKGHAAAHRHLMRFAEGEMTDEEYDEWDGHA